MKKILIVFVMFCLTCCASYADSVEMLNYIHINMNNLWHLNGKYEEKILEVGTKIVNANKLDKRVAFQMNRSTTTVNANTSLSNKVVTVYYGLLPYIDNDDELAFVLGHEIGHAIDAYGGPFKWVAMTFNSKEYENKADLTGIDLMVKAGYNPVAAITCSNKWMGESYWDTSIFTSHPQTSKRLMSMYKYIYVKYPWALKTDMVKNVNYENFTYSSKKEIAEFLQHEKERSIKQNLEDL